jgi:hypothetical protein
MAHQIWFLFLFENQLFIFHVKILKMGENMGEKYSNFIIASILKHAFARTLLQNPVIWAVIY